MILGTRNWERRTMGKTRFRKTRELTVNAETILDSDDNDVLLEEIGDIWNRSR